MKNLSSWSFLVSSHLHVYSHLLTGLKLWKCNATANYLTESGSWTFEIAGLVSFSCRLYVSVNSKPDHPPRAKSPGNFFDGRIPHPRAKKEFKTPTPRAYNNELKPHPRAFFSIIHYKDMKKSDRNHVKLQDFIIFRWLKDKRDLTGDPAYIIGKFTLIICKTLYIFVRIYGLILDAIWRLGSIRIKINTQRKVDKY